MLHPPSIFVTIARELPGRLVVYRSAAPIAFVAIEVSNVIAAAEYSA